MSISYSTGSVPFPEPAPTERARGGQDRGLRAVLRPQPLEISPGGGPLPQLRAGGGIQPRVYFYFLGGGRGRGAEPCCTSGASKKCWSAALRCLTLGLETLRGRLWVSGRSKPGRESTTSYTSRGKVLIRKWSVVQGSTCLGNLGGLGNWAPTTCANHNLA